MAKRRKRRARVVTKPPVVEEEIVVEEDDDEELEDEEEEEDEEPAPKPKRKKRKKKAVVEPVEEDDDEEEDEEPAPKPKRKKRKVVEEPVVAPKPKKRRKKKVVVPEPEPEEVEVDAEELLYNLLDSMDDGQSITVTRLDDASWTVSKGGVVAVGPAKLKGKAYYAEVYSQEFADHQTEWRQLTFAEKKAQAKKLGLEWEAHSDPRIEVIRITSLVRAELGIEKYKEQYRSRSARAVIKE